MLPISSACASSGIASRCCLPHRPGVVPLLPQLGMPPLPCRLAVHREIHGNRLVRRVFDFLAEAVPAALEPGA